MKIKITTLFCLLILFVSCEATNEDFYISNPTSNQMTLSIDKENYTLKPNSFEKIKLKPATHTLVYNGKSTDFSVMKKNKGGIINPSLSAHYIFSMIYAEDGGGQNMRSIAKQIYIDDILYEDNIRATNALFIDNLYYNCTYQLDQEFPEIISVNDSQMTGNFYQKFFTKAEFIDFYKSMLDDKYKNFHEENKDENGQNTITEPSEIIINAPRFSDPEMQAVYQKQYDLAIEFFTTRDLKRQAKIQKELFDLTVKNVHINANRYKLTNEENQRINDFIEATGRIQGAALVALK